MSSEFLTRCIFRINLFAVHDLFDRSRLCERAKFRPLRLKWSRIYYAAFWNLIAEFSLQGIRREIKRSVFVPLLYRVVYVYVIERKGNMIGSHSRIPFVCIFNFLPFRGTRTRFTGFFRHAIFSLFSDTAIASFQSNLSTKTALQA